MVLTISRSCLLTFTRLSIIKRLKTFLRLVLCMTSRKRKKKERYKMKFLLLGDKKQLSVKMLLTGSKN